MASRLVTGRVVLAGLYLAVLGLACTHEDPEPINGFLSVQAIDQSGTPVTGASVYIDDRLVGTTPYFVEILRGRYRVDVETPAGYIGASTVDVLRGETAESVLTLVPGPAALSHLSVRTLDASQAAIAGIPIFVDGEMAGRTPAMIDVTPGVHTVGVDSLGFIVVDEQGFMADVRDSTVDALRNHTHDIPFVLAPGFERTVLIEDHTNIDCRGCQSAEEDLYDILAAGDYGLSQVLPISLHTAIPVTSDPMFQANYREILWRYSTFNGVALNPAFVIDGYRLPAPPPMDEVRDLIAIHRRGVVPVDLEVEHSVSGTTVAVDVTVRSVSSMDGDWRLLVMTLQTGIEYPTPLGLYPEGWVFRNVVRDLTPAASPPATATSGHLITIAPGTVTVPFEAQLLTVANPPDDVANLAVVVVLQNWTTKEVLQVASTLE